MPPLVKSAMIAAVAFAVGIAAASRDSGPAAADGIGPVKAEQFNVWPGYIIKGPNYEMRPASIRVGEGDNRALGDPYDSDDDRATIIFDINGVKTVINYAVVPASNK